MKGKVWLAVIILVLIIGAGVAEQLYVVGTFDSALEKCNEINSCISRQDYETAHEKTHQLADWWSKQRDILEFICPNNDVKGIWNAIGDLDGSLQANMQEDSLQRCISLAYTLENSKNLLAFKWKNVL